MPELGEKFTCADCETKYYDLGRPDAVCPKCGSANRVVDEDLASTPRASRARAHPKPVPVPSDDESATEENGEAEEELDLSEVEVEEAEGQDDEG